MNGSPLDSRFLYYVDNFYDCRLLFILVSNCFQSYNSACRCDEVLADTLG